jgi:hypothetical protein
MKKLFIALRVLLCVWCFGLASAAYAGNVWSTLSQADRNARIVAQARTTVPPYPSQLAGECKPFAVDVVRVASNQANGYVWDGVKKPPGDDFTRTLPYTADWYASNVTGPMTAYFWVYNVNVVSTPGNGYSTLPSAVPGSIIQMRMKLVSGGFTPHTAIVEFNDAASQTITLTESNYKGDWKTGRRGPISYYDFIGQLEDPYKYTIYQIK